MSRPGRRSKLSICASWFSEPLTRLKQVQTRPKHSTVRRRYCMSVNAILSTGPGQGQVSKGHLSRCASLGPHLNTLSFQWSLRTCHIPFLLNTSDFCLLNNTYGPTWIKLSHGSAAHKWTQLVHNWRQFHIFQQTTIRRLTAVLSAEYPLAGVDV